MLQTRLPGAIIVSKGTTPVDPADMNIPSFVTPVVRKDTNRSTMTSSRRVATMVVPNLPLVNYPDLSPSPRV